MGRVLADSDVLFPFSLMDLLLALSEDSVHEMIWTDDLLDEWERVIVGKEKRSPASAAQVTRTVREFFHDSEVERAEYEHLIDEMPGKDPDDHVHMAAAVVRRPCTILTNNVKDFPPKPLAKRGVRVIDVDTYLCEIASELPDEMVATVVRLAAEKSKPTKTPHGMLEDLAHAGVPRFAEAIRPLLPTS